jgi:hypothetical protein
VCGGLFGTLPFISTAFQFFDAKLFDILFTFGKQDFESVSEIMKGHSKRVNYDPMIPSSEFSLKFLNMIFLREEI